MGGWANNPNNPNNPHNPLSFSRGTLRASHTTPPHHHASSPHFYTRAPLPGQRYATLAPHTANCGLRITLQCILHRIPHIRLSRSITILWGAPRRITSGTLAEHGEHRAPQARARINRCAPSRRNHDPTAHTALPCHDLGHCRKFSDLEHFLHMGRVYAPAAQKS